MADVTRSGDLDIDAALASADGYLREGRLKQAEDLCRRILVADENRPETLYLLGAIASLQGRHNRSLDFFRRACASPRASAAYYGDFAEAARRVGLLIEAEAAARRAISLDPSLALSWNTLGVILWARGSIEDGDHCIRQATSLDPGLVSALNNLGNIHRRDGRFTEAVSIYEAAICRDPRSAVARQS